jgi:hypothetical protein
LHIISQRTKSGATASLMFSRILNDEVSDTTDDDSSTAAGNIKLSISKVFLQQDTGGTKKARITASLSDFI